MYLSDFLPNIRSVPFKRNVTITPPKTETLTNKAWVSVMFRSLQFIFNDLVWKEYMRLDVDIICFLEGQDYNHATSKPKIYKIYKFQ